MGLAVCVCESGDPVEVTARGDTLRPPDSPGSPRFGPGWWGRLAAQRSRAAVDHVALPAGGDRERAKLDQSQSERLNEPKTCCEDVYS